MKSLSIKILCTISLLTLLFLGRCAQNIPINTTPQGRTESTSSSQEPLSDDDRMQKALDYFKAAQGYVLQYEKSQDISDFNTAIEYYQKYYELLPNGDYAALAILSIVELYCDIGDFENAREGLNILNTRYDLRRNYEEEIEYLEKRIEQRQ